MRHDARLFRRSTNTFRARTVAVDFKAPWQRDSTCRCSVCEMVVTNVEISAVSTDVSQENCVDDDVQTFSNPAKYLFQVSKLTKSLYLCGACAIRPDTFDDLDITCVINCTTDRELPDPPLTENVTIYLRIPVLDSPTTDLSRHFQRIVDIIKKVEAEGGRTLVHCVAGVSRSASICLAYLIKHHNLSLRDAYKYVEKRRPCIKPNNVFFKQLITFETELRGIPSVSMILDRVTDSYIPDIYYYPLNARKYNYKIRYQLQ